MFNNVVNMLEPQTWAYGSFLFFFLFIAALIAWRKEQKIRSFIATQKSSMQTECEMLKDIVKKSKDENSVTNA